MLEPKDYITIGISILSLVLATVSLIISQKLERNSHRVGCDIIDRFYEDNLSIVIVNRGISPITIMYFVAKCEEKLFAVLAESEKLDHKTTKLLKEANEMIEAKFKVSESELKKIGSPEKYFMEIMPKVDQKWNGFSLRIAGRVLPPNNEIVLFAIAPVKDDVREKILDAMNNLKMAVAYRDVFGKIHGPIMYDGKLYTEFFKKGEYRVGNNKETIPH